MREIKFRVWDKDVCAYIDRKHTFDFANYLRLNFDEGNGIAIDSLCPGRYIYEQYTGLKDKNGKEIYEGDIMRYDAIDYEIYWEDEYAGWFNRRIDGRGETHGSDSFYLVTSLGSVVSNIHENPELLNPCNSTELGEIK